jgi:iron complex outermembrane receptor protein
MDVRNAILPFQVEGVEGRDFFRNAGRTRHRGIEATVAAALGPHSASLAYTLNDFTFAEDTSPGGAREGNRLPGIPRHHVFGAVTLHPRADLRLDVEVEHTGGFFADDANQAASRNDAATIADVRATFDLRLGGIRLTPFLAINNATDTEYNGSVVVNAFGARWFEPAPGRNVHVGISVRSGSWAW